LTFVLVGLPNSLVRRFHTGKEEAQAHTPNPFIGNFTARPSKKHGPVLGKHKYRADGLLEVNLDGPHPIYELIARAEKEWEGKLSRSSKTLQEAVKEYKRRYNRAPPKGFDLWYVLLNVYHQLQVLTWRPGGNMRKSTTSSCPTSTTRYTMI